MDAQDTLAGQNHHVPRTDRLWTIGRGMILLWLLVYGAVQPAHGQIGKGAPDRTLTTVLPKLQGKKLLSAGLLLGGAHHVIFWTPSTKDIQQLEADLPAFAKTVQLPSWSKLTRSPNITSYNRQYLGYIWKGKRLIFVNGFHHAIIGDRLFHSVVTGKNDWHTHALIFADGGTAFFHVTYDPRPRRFVDFSFNGHV